MNIPKLNLIHFCTRFHLYIHVYALLLQSRGLTLVQISAIESAVIGTIFLMEVPTGVLADRIGRRWSVAASTLFLMSGELLFLFSQTYILYLGVALLTGTGFAFASGATEALIYDSLLPENRHERMKQVMGRYGSIGQIAFFLSPIVGGLIVADLTPARFNTAIALTVATLFIGVLVSLTLVEPPTPWAAGRPHPLTIFRNGLTEIRGNPALRRFVLVAMLATPFNGTLITTLAAPYLKLNQVSPFGIGLALSIGSLFAALTQHHAFRVERWVGAQRGLLILTLLPGVSYLVLAGVTSPVPAWLMIVWMYGINDMKNPLFSAYQNALITTDSRATTLSLMNMLVNLFIVVMAPLYAALAQESLSLAFAAIGSIILTAGIALRLFQENNDPG